MKIPANDIKKGNILVYKDALWVVSKQPTHVKLSKGGACVQVEMKNFKTGTKLNERINSLDWVEKASVEKRELQYLYVSEEDIYMMYPETGDQITIDKGILDDRLLFLENGMMVTVEFYEEKPLNVILPFTIICEIAETDPVMKGATVTSSYKPAVLTNGVIVKVPPYLTAGEKIVIKTEDSSYVERAK